MAGVGRRLRGRKPGRNLYCPQPPASSLRGTGANGNPSRGIAVRRTAFHRAPSAARMSTESRFAMSGAATTESRVLQLDPRDNVLVALTDLRKGERASFQGRDYLLLSDVPAK